MAQASPGTPPALAGHPGRILIIRPSALGDVCRSVPVLASLRRAYPSAQIDWVVQDSFAPAVRHHPALSNLIAFPRARFGSLARTLRYGPILRWMNDLRRSRYDVVLDCQGLARSAAFTWATGAPVRVGYANAPEGAWLAYTNRVHADKDLHAVDRMLALVAAAGIEPVTDMRLYADPAERAAVDEQLGHDPFVIVAPTARWPGKRWPQERFAQAIAQLLDRGIPRVVIVGSPDERPQCSVLVAMAQAQPRVIDLIGATTVGRLMALVQRSAAVLCNDSAVLHMAVGFDRPIVALYGPTRVGRVGPYGRSADVIQHVRESDRMDHKDAAAGAELMDRISVAEVARAVLDRYRPIT